MVIVVTDEVGDDETHLEEAIDVAGKAKVPVYVLGSQAIFGRVEGFMDYTDPKTKQTYHNLPVRQGPESVMLEQIRLPFWYDGPQYDMLDSGFGPYALSRLAGATGGIYFVTRLGQQPDGVRPGRDARVQARLGQPRASTRPTVAKQPDPPGGPRGGADHPAEPAGPALAAASRRPTGPSSRRRWPRARRSPPGPPTPSTRRSSRSCRVAKLPRPRDLAPLAGALRPDPGRLLAMKIRCYEYNWACAKMKKDAPKFTEARLERLEARPRRGDPL